MRNKPIKIKAFEFDGKKLDSAIVKSDDDVQELIKRWKLKGIM
jgi:hypothetical protein